MLTIEKRNEIILNKYYLIERIAKNIINQSKVPEEEYDDLCNEGVIGFIDSLNRYDENTGKTIKDFCEFRIKGAMKDYLRRIDPLKRDHRNRINNKKILINDYIIKNLKEPSEKQLEYFSNLDTDDYFNQIGQYEQINISSFDEIFFENIPDKSSNSLNEFILKDFADYCLKLIPDVSKRDKEIFIKYYYSGKTNLDKVGEKYNLVGSRVSQIISVILKKIRKRIKEKI